MSRRDVAARRWIGDEVVMATCNGQAPGGRLGSSSGIGWGIHGLLSQAILTVVESARREVADEFGTAGFPKHLWLAVTASKMYVFTQDAKHKREQTELASWHHCDADLDVRVRPLRAHLTFLITEDNIKRRICLQAVRKYGGGGDEFLRILKQLTRVAR